MKLFFVLAVITAVCAVSVPRNRDRTDVENRDEKYNSQNDLEGSETVLQTTTTVPPKLAVPLKSLSSTLKELTDTKHTTAAHQQRQKLCSQQLIQLTAEVKEEKKIVGDLNSKIGNRDIKDTDDEIKRKTEQMEDFLRRAKESTERNEKYQKVHNTKWSAYKKELKGISSKVAKKLKEKQSDVSQKALSVLRNVVHSERDPTANYFTQSVFLNTRNGLINNAYDLQYDIEREKLKFAKTEDEKQLMQLRLLKSQHERTLYRLIGNEEYSKFQCSHEQHNYEQSLKTQSSLKNNIGTFKNLLNKLALSKTK